jgi:hypothetical protein
MSPGSQVIVIVFLGWARLSSLSYPPTLIAIPKVYLTLARENRAPERPTSNCWGVDNMSKGTNTNRLVVMRKKRCAG